MIEIGKLAQNISTELFALGKRVEKKTMTPEEIYNSRKALANSSVGWNPSGSTYPNNLHLQNGLEEELAIVDRWCGGYQDPHKPRFIGWKVQKNGPHGSKQTRSGVVKVKSTKAMRKGNGLAVENLRELWGSSIKVAMEKARLKAEEALNELYPQLEIN